MHSGSKIQRETCPPVWNTCSSLGDGGLLQLSLPLHEKQDTPTTPHQDVLGNVRGSPTHPSQKWGLLSGKEMLEGLVLLRRSNDGDVD